MAPVLPSSPKTVTSYKRRDRFARPKTRRPSGAAPAFGSDNEWAACSQPAAGEGAGLFTSAKTKRAADGYSLPRAFLTAAARSLIKMGFMTKARTPICLAFSWSTVWL